MHIYGYVVYQNGNILYKCTDSSFFFYLANLAIIMKNAKESLLKSNVVVLFSWIFHNNHKTYLQCASERTEWTEITSEVWFWSFAHFVNNFIPFFSCLTKPAHFSINIAQYCNLKQCFHTVIRDICQSSEDSCLLSLTKTLKNLQNTEFKKLIYSNISILRLFSDQKEVVRVNLS